MNNTEMEIRAIQSIGYDKGRKSRDAEVQALKNAIQMALTFIADINGSDWITGTDAGALDMKQRAKHLQPKLYNILNPK